jgi:hypothetical protein
MASIVGAMMLSEMGSVLTMWVIMAPTKITTSSAQPRNRNLRRGITSRMAPTSSAAPTTKRNQDG